MKHLRFIVGLFALTIATAIFAAKGDTFTAGDLTLTVLTENATAKTGTVSVQASSTSISGNVVVEPQYVHNGITYKTTAVAKVGFKNCVSITGVTLPENVKYIYSEAFLNCSKLAFVDIPASLEYVGERAFSMDYALERVDIHNLAAWRNIDFDVSRSTLGLENPLYYAGHLFLDGEEITEIKIPEGVTEIKDLTFAGLNGITSLSLPSTLTKIGIHSFMNCEGLTSLHIPGNVKQVERGAFQGCKNLADLVIDEGVEALGMLPQIDRSDCRRYLNNTTVGQWDHGGTFEGCTALTEVTLPSSISIVQRRAFRECTSLQKVNLPSTIEQIYMWAFFKCEQLREINLPEGLFWIDRSSFEGCNNLDTAIPSTVTHLGMWAFANANMTSVVIPENVDSIEGYCFAYNHHLNEVKLNQSLKYIGNAVFMDCADLESIALPDGLLQLGDPEMELTSGAFSMCSKIRSIKMPNSIMTIGDETFANCFNLTHITLPTYLQYFGCYVLDCWDENPLIPKMTEITFPKDVEVDETYYAPGDEECRPAINHIFVMGDMIEDNMKTITSDKDMTFYVKKSVYDRRYSTGKYKGTPVAYKVPLSMTNAAGTPIEYMTLCRDFDVDLTHTNDNLPEGVEPLRAYVVEDVDGELRLVFLDEIKYIPSRLKANVTDENGNLYQGVDEYVGVVLRGTPGYTYYYEIGEHDYTQGAEGQWLLDDAMEYSGGSFVANLMAGDANDDFYVCKTTLDEYDNRIINYGLNNGRFKIYNKDGWLAYNKSYLRLPKDVSEAIEESEDAEGNVNLTFVFNNADGSTNRVSSAEFMKSAESDIFYNTMGQRVDANAKGIVINGGRKLYNK